MNIGFLVGPNDALEVNLEYVNSAIRSGHGSEHLAIQRAELDCASEGWMCLKTFYVRAVRFGDINNERMAVGCTRYQEVVIRSPINA